jgi:hypothetical protein
MEISSKCLRKNGWRKISLTEVSSTRLALSICQTVR